MSNRPQVAERPVSRTPVGPPPAPPSVHNVGFRPEIQGLRAVAVLLVAVYHIWLGRVSGGVDVFLMLTGFLLTASLLRTADKRGKVNVLAFWARLARRLFPTAALVLIGVLLAALLWLPQARWQDTLSEIIASALYLENWQLALNSVDYLAQGNATSPVQHFWSLSIQGQFYLILPVLVTVAVLWRARTKVALLGLLAGLFVVSLAYSIYQTAADQPWAYFDTGARLWEFALGGIVAIVLPRLKLPQRLRIGLGWLGLIGLISCGLLLSVSTVFPGFAALWPTGAAILIILAGTTGSRLGADRLLANRVLNYFGDISYALYLWHWPVLVIYLEVTGQDTVGVRGGLAILLLSVGLADVTSRVVARGIGFFRPGIRSSVLVSVPSLLLVVATSAACSGYLSYRDHQLQLLAKDPRSYPGAAALHSDRDLPEVPYAPSASQAKWDLPAIVEDGCQQQKVRSEVLVCSYGSRAKSAKTIVLAGSSLAAHWFPTVERAAKENDWKLVTVIKSGCPLSVGGAPDDGGVPEPSCAEWQPAALQRIVKLKPDLVITPATRSAGGHERLPKGYLHIWRKLDAAGIEILGLRDSPRATRVASECVEKRGPDACLTPRGASLSAKPPYEGNSGVPSNVSFADLTEHICRADGQCPPIVGNVLVYRDRSHLSATYARTLAPMLEKEVQAVLG